MDVLIVMCLGIIVGRFIVPNSAKKWSELTSIICTFILILSMGIKLGKNENFLNDLSTLGLSSLLFFLIPTVLSIIIVFILTKKFMIKENTAQEEEVDE